MLRNEAEAAGSSQLVNNQNADVSETPREMALPSSELREVIEKQNQLLQMLLQANVGQYQQHRQTQADRMAACHERMLVLEMQIADIHRQRDACIAKQRELSEMQENQNRLLNELELDYKTLLSRIQELEMLYRHVEEAQSKSIALAKQGASLLHEEGEEKKLTERTVILEKKYHEVDSLIEPVCELASRINHERVQLVRKADELRGKLDRYLQTTQVSSFELAVRSADQHFFKSVSEKRDKNAERCRALSRKLDEVVADLHQLEAQRIARNYAVGQSYNNHSHRQPDLCHQQNIARSEEVIDWSEVSVGNSTGLPTNPVTFKH